MQTRVVVATAALTAACLLGVPVALEAAPSPARPPMCGDAGYGYAGLASAGRVRGIAATVSAVSRPSVASGHAAAWVGVGEGRAGGWLQIGLAAFPERPLRLYVEHVRPGGRRTYAELPGRARTGRPYALAVVEVAGRAGWWRAYLDGRPVGAVVRLARADGERAFATSESWVAAGRPCNSLAYRFDTVRGASAGSWRLLARATIVRTPGFTLASPSRDAFLAARRAA